MGLFSGSVSLTRYRFTEKPPASVYPEVMERLRRNAFREIEDTSDERSWGFVSADDWLDSFWREAPPEKGGWLVFGFRLDTRRVSPAVLKKHVLLATRAEEQKAKQDGRNFVSRERRKEIREQVAARLMARTPPVPALFDVAWNVAADRVLVSSVTPRLLDLFEDHFTLSFDLHLERLTPFVLGLEALGERRREDLERFTPAAFV
jgi:hypothetical protein